MPGKTKETICILILTILGLLFFYKTFHFGFFNVDDLAQTADSIAVKRFDLHDLLMKYQAGFYHPLTTLSIAIDWWLGDTRPWIFHLNNIVFHLLSTLILFQVTLKLWPKKFLCGFLISLTFLLHPLKAESVVWITERKDVLSGLFLWLTIYFYMLNLDKKKSWQYIFSNIAFFLALASKISVAPLPIFLFVIDWYWNQKIKFRSVLKKAPFFIMALIFGLLNVLEQSRVLADATIQQKNYSDLIYQMQFYIEKFLFPWGLRAWYSIELLGFNPLGITSAALICALAVIIYKKTPTRKKDLLFGISFFLLFLFPNLRVVPPGEVNLVNDRYMYIALTGLTFAFFPYILQSIEHLWRNQRRFISFGLSALFATLIFQWLYLMHIQIPYWKDSVTLWQRTAMLEPNSRVVAGYYANALLKAGRNEEALPYLRNSQGRVEDYEDLGYLLYLLKKPDEAKNVILEGLMIYPANPGLLDVLGEIKLADNQSQEALSLFIQALQDQKNQLIPERRATILNHAGMANTELGYYEAAEPFFREALKISDDDCIFVYHLGLALLKQNRLEEAKNLFSRAIKLNPKFVEAYNMIGAIFYQEKNFAEARIWFNRTLEIEPNFEIAINNLATMENEGQ